MSCLTGNLNDFSSFNHWFHPFMAPEVVILFLLFCFRNSSCSDLVPKQSMVLPAEYSDEVSFGLYV